MKKKEPLDRALAEQMLLNVFTACRREPNSVPLEVLTSYSNYRKERYSMQRAVIIVVLALFLLLPVLFVPPHLTVTQRTESPTGNPMYDVKVSTRLPILEIHAGIGGVGQPISETASHEYCVTPGINGEMTVTVVLLNRQTDTYTVSVTDVDTERPQLVSVDYDGDTCILTVSDDGCGVDYDGITVTDESGAVTSPLSCDSDTGRVVIAYPKTVTTISIPDHNGNVLPVRITPEA